MATAATTTITTARATATMAAASIPQCVESHGPLFSHQRPLLPTHTAHTHTNKHTGWGGHHHHGGWHRHLLAQEQQATFDKAVAALNEYYTHMAALEHRALQAVPAAAAAEPVPLGGRATEGEHDEAGGERPVEEGAKDGYGWGGRGWGRGGGWGKGKGKGKGYWD